MYFLNLYSLAENISTRDNKTISEERVQICASLFHNHHKYISTFSADAHNLALFGKEQSEFAEFSLILCFMVKP